MSPGMWFRGRKNSKTRKTRQTAIMESTDLPFSFWRCSPMAATRTRKRSRSALFLQKPRGTFHPRVQQVGPEHFGIVSVDCAEARSKWMLSDFYGHVIAP